MKHISIVIPTWERVEMTMNSFAKVYNDDRISNIVIVDDASSMETFNKFRKYDNLPKVKLYRNLTNQDCYTNKFISVSYSPTQFCILFDSDNIIDTDYIDRIFEQQWDAKTILAPTFAAPLFDYRTYSGIKIDRTNVSEYMGKPMFDTALNTHNMFVNRDEYLQCFDPNVNPHSSDSIFMNYQWLNRGNSIYFVPELTYQHTVHENSHYKTNCHKSPEFYKEIEEKLKNMK